MTDRVASVAPCGPIMRHTFTVMVKVNGDVALGRERERRKEGREAGSQVTTPPLTQLLTVAPRKGADKNSASGDGRTDGLRPRPVADKHACMDNSISGMDVRSLVRGCVTLLGASSKPLAAVPSSPVYGCSERRQSGEQDVTALALHRVTA